METLSITKGYVSFGQTPHGFPSLKTLELRQSVLADPDRLTQFLENTHVISIDLQHTSLRKMTNFTQFIVTVMNNKPLTLNFSYC